MPSQPSSSKPVAESTTTKTLVYGGTTVSELQKTSLHKPRFIPATIKSLLLPLLTCLLIASEGMLWAGTTGSISGTLKDPTGALVPGATVQAINVAQGVHNKITSDANGLFIFPSLPVGHYDLQVEAPGFKTEKRTGLVIDADVVLRIEAVLQLAEKTEEVVVTTNEMHVDTETTQMGEVITGPTMTAVALNGRSFTDLLALQPGIVPVTTQQPNSVVMAGASVAIPPSGELNPGNQSISGQREDSNGYIVNGGDVKEMMNGGTAIVPNLDSVAEFRVLTNNYDAEYGNFTGGVVNVVTKSGTDHIHGSIFEFLRNTVLDARNFFSPEQGFFRQNQYGGTIGGPIGKKKLFFFADYQGTRNKESVDTGLIPVPSLANRAGDFSGNPGSLTGTVSGPFLAGLLSQRLGYAVSANEPYFTPGCTNSAQCVFPNALIPQQAWSAPAINLLRYIPAPNIGTSTFSTASQGKTLRDDKGGVRVDANTGNLGLLSAYYYFDDYSLDNPYPTGQGGASVPGFNALTLGRGQLVSLSQTKTLGSNAVNEVRLNYMRNANDVGHPVGGVGVRLASQGFVTGPGTSGIVPLAPNIEGVENVIFSSFVMGTTITGLKQVNDTFSLSDNFSKVLGRHTLKFGGEASLEQVNVNPNPTFNGSFAFFGSETGSDFADFLIGTPSNYNQADSRPYYGRHKYYGAFAQDSWHMRPNLVFNYGLRWERMEYWSEKYNQIPTLVLGQQSVIYPTAPIGIVYPGDPGIPDTLVPARNRFSPRFGLAYSPSKSQGWLGKVFGGPGKTSIRAGYGIFYSAIQGNTIAIDEPQPPFGLSYTSPAPPLFSTPFITAANGQVHPQPFPVHFPALNGASQSHPDGSVDFSSFIPIAGLTTPDRNNTFPYNENYFFSIERELGTSTLVRLSYVGSQAHHLLVVFSANPGNPALCLALSQPSAVAPGSPTCGPFGESNTYITASGQQINSTRGPFGAAFANDDFEGSVGNSSYNSLQASVRHTGHGLTLLFGYTYSKSLDQSSSLADPVNPFNHNLTRALSAFDLRHVVVASYEYQLPFDHFFSRGKSLLKGWTISGITRVSSGFPVTISSDGDTSLMGSLPNGVNNQSLDLPDFTPGPLNLNSNPRNGQSYFNTFLFQPQALGTPGNSPRRFFYGPGMFNSDLALLRSFQFSESKALQFRLETFNTFNHTQFFGPAAVNGDSDSDLFGHVVKAAAPRLMQIAVKFSF
jgi:Carboxypeptidase regulatory-like domain